MDAYNLEIPVEIGSMNACRKMTSEEVPINWRSSLMRSFPTCRHISRESSMKRIQEQAVHHQGIEHFCDHLFNQWKQHVINRNMSQILKKNF
tara:strand:+ start:225 stop:500 length:276 start_codon:yes stop_codon:yes gene_type:complete